MLALAAGLAAKSASPPSSGGPLKTGFRDARWLHLFGAAAEFLPLVETARASGVKVVLSPELWRECRTTVPRPRLAAADAGLVPQDGAGTVHAERPPGSASCSRRSICCCPIRNVEAQRIARRTKLPMERMRVVPHGVDPRLAAGRSAAVPPARRRAAISCSMPARSSPTTSNSASFGR